MTRIMTLLSMTGLIWSLATLGATPDGRVSDQAIAVSTAELMRLGTAAERACHIAEAISAYEKLLQRDLSYERILAPRLVDLYVAGGQPARALSWAGRVASRHPDPQAYLAGVHARLRQWKEAEILLRQTLHATTALRKRLPLLWQLADVQEGQGDSAAAVVTLSGACEATPDEALRKTSAQRLAALRKRISRSLESREKIRTVSKKEAQP